MLANYLPLPSPFGLLQPSEVWLATLASFDVDLVLFPSQKLPGVYRLMRRARRSGGITARVFRAVTGIVHPDTKIAFDHHLVAVATVPAAAIAAPCEHLCAQLALRDTWRYGPLDQDGAALALEQKEAAEAAARTASYRDDAKVRHRAARVGFLYRTGARVSLVRPWRPGAAGSSSSSTPPAAAGPVSTPEVS